MVGVFHFITAIFVESIELPCYLKYNKSEYRCNFLFVSDLQTGGYYEN